VAADPDDTTDWQDAGVVAVDSGNLWLGDPCYLLDPSRKRPRELGTSWADVIPKMSASATQQWSFDAGTPGLGVTVATGHGDGHYVVKVRRTATGKVAAVKVAFIDADAE
jgi:hypothetical protein